MIIGQLSYCLPKIESTASCSCHPRSVGISGAVARGCKWPCQVSLASALVTAPSNKPDHPSSPPCSRGLSRSQQVGKLTKAQETIPYLVVNQAMPLSAIGV